jgi:multidrug efflux system membrane fusion protein
VRRLLERIGGAAAIASLLAGCGRSPPASPASGADGAEPPEVTLETTVRRELPQILQVSGRTEARALIAIKARVDGPVAEIAYEEGRPVRKGQLLVRLDDSVLRSQLHQAEALLARDEAVLEKSRADLRRSEALLAQNFVSASAVDQARSTLHADEATLQSDRAAAEATRLQLQFTRVEAPADGVAGIAQLTVGGMARANDTTLMTIAQVDPIYVTFSLPESQLAVLRAALHRGDVPAEATLTGRPTPLHGRVAFLDNTVDTTTGAITGKATFANADGLVTPGQFATLSLQVGRLPAGMLVPDTAIESGNDSAYVFVVDAGRHVHIQPVKVTARSAGMSLVTGLAEGDRVVTGGQDKLRDHAAVRVSGAASR